MGGLNGVEISETHAAVVIFIGDRAYKVKKPVSLGFLDFTRLETRRQVCHRELALNRRFAPDVYLDVATITDSGGTPCEYMVVMRRLPADRRLATLVRGGEDVLQPLKKIARLMARVHAASPTSPAISAVATRDSVQRHWEDSFAQMQPFVGPVLPEAMSEKVERLARAYLAGRKPLFDRRIEEERIRDGHGDLLADDIFCLDDGPRVLDCLEFDDRLRWGDVLADVAFLAMDLERLGAPDMADRFLRFYREFSNESYPPSLAEHYLAYRAHVRAKVASIRQAQGDSTAAAEATRLLAQASRHLEYGRIRLVLVGGPPGTGKSTLASAISDAIGAALIRSDEVRKDLAGLGHDQPARAPFGEGLYRPEDVAATYREVLRRARIALGLGESVILDATFTDARWRDAAAQVALETSSELVAFECAVNGQVAHARLAGRRSDHAFGSDATADIGDRFMAAHPAWPSAIRIDTSGSREASLRAALRSLETPRQAA